MSVAVAAGSSRTAERIRFLRSIVLRPESLLLAAALAAAVWVAQLQRSGERPSDFDTYSSYDVQSGGYRAWYELLERERVSVVRFEERPAFLDASTRTLVYSEPLAFDPRQTSLSKGDIGDLENWVRAGGLLVYLGHDDDASRSGILGLPASHLSKDAGVRSPRPIIAPLLRAAGVTHVAASGALRWRTARHRRFTVLYSDARGPLVVRYPFGHGSITAIIDETMLSNSRIALGDHARLAYVLAATGPVTFMELQHGYYTPEHWWSVVPRNFTIALGIACGALLIAMAGAALRLGPPVVPFEREATSAEFIDSLAGLFERARAARKALEDAVTSTRRTVATAVGLDSQAAGTEIAARIPGAAERANFLELLELPARPAIDDAVLVRGLGLAQSLRKEYAHGRSRH